MKKLLGIIFPAPLLSALLIILWMVMTQGYSLANFVLALILGFGIPIFTDALRPRYVSVRHPLVIVKLAWIVMIDAWKSNWMVIRILLKQNATKEDTSIFVRIPLDMRDPNGLAVLAVITTITPGNAWAELSMDRSTLLLHVFDGQVDKEEVIKTVKERYERPLMEIFE